MADEKKERGLNYLALTTVILAVCATLPSFRGSSCSTRAVMSQTQAASQWSYFQSRSIKGWILSLLPGNVSLVCFVPGLLPSRP